MEERSFFLQTSNFKSVIYSTFFLCHCEHCASNVWQSHTLSPDKNPIVYLNTVKNTVGRIGCDCRVTSFLAVTKKGVPVNYIKDSQQKAREVLSLGTTLFSRHCETCWKQVVAITYFTARIFSCHCEPTKGRCGNLIHLFPHKK